MAYLLDANVFIQAKNLHYGFDFCPAFWEWIVRENQAGSVLSISQISDELIAGNDELADWAREQSENFFPDTDSATLPALAEVAAWVQSQDFEQAAVNTFLQVADYYLVAYARAHAHTVVTHEIPSESLRKVKIPTVCIGMGVKFVTPYAMLRRAGARFVLAP